MIRWKNEYGEPDTGFWLLVLAVLGPFELVYQLRYRLRRKDT